MVWLIKWSKIDHCWNRELSSILSVSLLSFSFIVIEPLNFEWGTQIPKIRTTYSNFLFMGLSFFWPIKCEARGEWDSRSHPYMEEAGLHVFPFPFPLAETGVVVVHHLGPMWMEKWQDGRRLDPDCFLEQSFHTNRKWTFSEQDVKDLSPHWQVCQNLLLWGTKYRNREGELP